MNVQIVSPDEGSVVLVFVPGETVIKGAEALGVLKIITPSPPGPAIRPGIEGDDPPPPPPPSPSVPVEGAPLDPPGAPPQGPPGPAGACPGPAQESPPTPPEKVVPNG